MLLAKFGFNELIEACGDTLLMTVISTLIAYITLLHI